MNRSEVRAFVKSGVDYLNQSIPFNSGRITEFNSEASKEMPYVWLESLSVSPTVNTYGAPQEDWTITLHVANLDKMDSSASEYEDIIDGCDLIAQELTKVYNDLLTNSKLVTLDSLNRDPFIKKHADCLTGVILSFTLQTWDTSSFCL